MALESSNNIPDATTKSQRQNNVMALGLATNAPMSEVHDETFDGTRDSELCYHQKNQTIKFCLSQRHNSIALKKAIRGESTSSNKMIRT